MKNRLLFVSMIFIIILLLSACGGSTSDAASSQDDTAVNSGTNSINGASPGTDNTPGIGEDLRGSLPLSAQLGFGTLYLETTEFAVDPEQAKELLPLWKAVKSLSSSDTVAEVELDAVFNQIEDTMTPEQMEAMSKMELNGDDMAQLMEDLGISFGFGGPGMQNLSPEMQATAEAARESGEGFPGRGFPEGGPGGGFPGGGPGGGGFMGGQGPGGPNFSPGNITPEQQATMEAFRAERGNAGFRFSLVFVDPLIELLEGRAGQ